MAAEQPRLESRSDIEAEVAVMRAHGRHSEAVLRGVETRPRCSMRSPLGMHVPQVLARGADWLLMSAIGHTTLESLIRTAGGEARPAHAQDRAVRGFLFADGRVGRVLVAQHAALGCGPRSRWQCVRSRSSCAEAFRRGDDEQSAAVFARASAGWLIHGTGLQ